jgi:hypothetical protein
MFEDEERLAIEHELERRVEQRTAGGGSPGPA